MKKASSELFLLDVNVLLALAWPNHQFNAAARRRFVSSRHQWATCAITQLGFIRLSSNPSAVSPAKTPREATGQLAQIINDPRHSFLDTMPMPAPETFANILGPNQVTDAYLLQIARFHDAVFVTFDKRMRSVGAHGQFVEILSL
jgi:toxin-antitoxin system PIN domain toxin